MEFKGLVDLGKSLDLKIPGMIVQLQYQADSLITSLRLTDLHDFLRYQLDRSRRICQHFEQSHATFGTDWPASWEAQLENERNRVKRMEQILETLLHSRENPLEARLVLLRQFPEIQRLLPKLLNEYRVNRNEELQMLFSEDPAGLTRGHLIRSKRKLLDLQMSKADFVPGEVPPELLVDIELIQEKVQFYSHYLREIPSQEELEQIPQAIDWYLDPDEIVATWLVVHDKLLNGFHRLVKRIAVYGGDPYTPLQYYNQIWKQRQEIRHIEVQLLQLLGEIMGRRKDKQNFSPLRVFLQQLHSSLQVLNELKQIEFSIASDPDWMEIQIEDLTKQISEVDAKLSSSLRGEVPHAHS